jgi:hypothetical protein
MARKVFFSFHHQKDSWRVGQVRFSWNGQKGTTNTFMDKAAWETVERKGEAVVKAWIDRQMDGTGVTVVLIGQHTASRPYVKYEIQQSIRHRKGILGIHIHGLKDTKRRTTRIGHNPLHDFTVTRDDPWFGFLGVKTDQKLSDIFQTFDWEEDNGRANMPDWIEEAARRANR